MPRLVLLLLLACPLCATIPVLSACGDDASPAGADGGADAAQSDATDQGPDSSELPPPIDCLSNFDCQGSGLPRCRTAVCEDHLCVVKSLPDHTICNDDDACSEDTECLGGECTGGRSIACDDGNPCTIDGCDPFLGCSHDPAPQDQSCEDGDPCTVEDHCLADGTCGGQTDPACACAVDADCGAFDDGNICNGVLRCVDGSCRMDPDSIKTCTASSQCYDPVCAPDTGDCDETAKPDGTDCDDLNPCTTDDSCKAGVCRGELAACACEHDADCKPFQTAGYDLCQGPLTCVDGLCQSDPQEAVKCPASELPCVAAACHPATGGCGLVPLPDGDTCASTDPCAPPGECQLGVCVTTGPDCDDQNPCTADTCAEGIGCEHVPQQGPCEDGDPCTQGDHCSIGVCQGGDPRSCEDANPCTIDSCDPGAGGCVHSPVTDGQLCDDDNLCTTGGTCEAGVCVGQQDVVCPDPAPCEVSTCVPDQGCVQPDAPDGAPCEDLNPCTETGSCLDGVCVAQSKVCADNNPCTVTGCDPAAGGCTVQEVLVGASCQPESPCLVDGVCDATGACVDGQPLVCDSGPCDVQACSEQTGTCVVTGYVDDGAPCGEEGPCLQIGSCADGVCVGAGPVVCDDGDACTVESCDPAEGGCVFEALDCPPGPDPCTLPACAPDVGCVDDPAPACAEGVLLLATAFACDDPMTGWSFEIEAGSIPFFVDADPDPPGAWDGLCSLNVNDGVSYASGAEPTVAHATTPELSPDGAAWAPGLEVVTVHFFEWVDLDGGDGTDVRSVALVDLYGETLSEQALLVADKAEIGWIERELDLPVPPYSDAAPPQLRVRFRLDTVDSVSNDGAGWFIDRLIVTAQ